MLLNCPNKLELFLILPSPDLLNFVFKVKKTSQLYIYNLGSNFIFSFNACLVQDILLVFMWSSYWFQRTWLDSLYKRLIGPVVSNHGNLGPCPRPWRGVVTTARPPLYADLGLGANGPRACHRKGEGGHGRGT